jgi:hypothetical protein
MTKERYNQIIDEVYKNYLNETMFSSDPTWLEPIPVMDMKTGEKSMGARQYHKEVFLNKCKTHNEFSEKWGLKIEERELSENERIDLALEWGHDSFDLDIAIGNSEDALTEYGIPSKVITVTYNNEMIKTHE